MVNLWKKFVEKTFEKYLYCRCDGGYIVVGPGGLEPPTTRL